MSKANTRKEPAQQPSQGTLSSDSVERTYRQYRQGAWVRSGASVFMGLFALLAYFLKQLDYFSLTGISLSIFYLVLINPPTLWILKRIRQKKSVRNLSLTIHGLEIIGYTAIFYFAGGMGRGFLTLLFSALITYVGVMSPRSWPFIITAFCYLSLSSLILLEYLQVIPDTSLALRVKIPYIYQLTDILIMTAVFLVIAFISSYTAGLLRQSREQLKARNTDLNQSKEKLEQAHQILQEKNMALKAAMERAQASDRKKSEFLANMSHELRTPLNHIIGFTELVTDQAVGPLNATQKEYLNDALSSSQHLLSLINDILDLSKVEAGKMELASSEIPLKKMVVDSLTMVKEKALKHQISLTPYFHEIPPTIWADERKLKQILYNLLSNAVKFTPDGGAVRISAQRARSTEFRIWSAQEMNDQFPTQQYKGDTDFIQISIEDTGIGLSEIDLERIFQPFEQADNSASRKYQGTGLGLSLARQMVQLHGGLLWAESKGEGRGSAFYFTLPCLKKEETER